MREPASLLAGRRGLVMGVSGENSVGYHCAQHMIRQGAHVVTTFRPAHAERGIAAAKSLGVRGFALEATDERSIADTFDTLAGEWGSMDFLVHTLAHAPRPGVLSQPLIESSPEDFAAVLHVSAYSLVAASRHALPLLKRSDSPRIVTLTSAGDTYVIPDYHLLGIAKAALIAALRHLAVELGPDGILCNAVSFSLVPTDGAARAIGASVVDRTRRHLERSAPAATPLTHQQVGEMIALLASPAWQHATGEVVHQDGGYALTYFRSAPRRATSLTGEAP